jgi:hypothetical protein
MPAPAPVHLLKYSGEPYRNRTVAVRDDDLDTTFFLSRAPVTKVLHMRGARLPLLLLLQFCEVVS